MSVLLPHRTLSPCDRFRKELSRKQIKKQITTQRKKADEILHRMIFYFAL